MIEKNFSDIAKDVIRKEAQALTVLSQTLDSSFSNAVELILNTTGRIVLTGIGKSSHIAKKIASTLASTGTPTFFIHPSEASHGDLGMLTANDLLIAFSKSGESAEFKEIIVYCKQMLIPIISVTAVTNSSLAKASDCILELPKIEEACPLGLAPTTSSIMMLALGDALAIACLEKKNFTRSNFKIFHPAGKLGLSLLKVFDIMHKEDELPIVKITANLSDAIIEMTRCRFGCVGILDDLDNLIGIFTDGDLRRNLLSVKLDTPIKNLMTYNPQVLDSDSFVIDVVKKFKEKKIPSIFVCKEHKPIGLLHLHDLLQKGFL